MSQGFHRNDSEFVKRQAFPQLSRMGCSMWTSVYTLPMGLPIGLSAVNSLYNLVVSYISVLRLKACVTTARLI